MNVIQIPAIGKHGRFCNWLLHYLTGKYYAERVGAKVATHHWIGRDLFDLDDLLIQKEEQPISGHTYLKPFNGTIALPPFFFLPFDLYSKCLTRTFVQKTLKWKPEFLSPYIPKVEAAVHVRRGDYSYLTDFPWIELPEICEALNRCGEDPDDVEFVREDEPHQIGVYPYGYEHIEDFQILMKAKRIYVYPRSTFSQVAALLGNGEVYMPFGWTKGKSIVNYKPVDTAKPILFCDPS